MAAPVIPSIRVDVPGGQLAAHRVGAGARRGLVIVAHGFPDHPPTFARVIDGLAARGLDVVAPWLRGYAPSTVRGPFGAEVLAADLLAIARALGAGRPVTLVGHDWGAVATYSALAGDAARAIAAAVTLAVPHPLAFARALGRDRQWRRSWYMGLFQLPGAARVAAARDFALIDQLWRTWSPAVARSEPERAALHACLAASWPAPLGHYRALVRPVRGLRDRLRAAARPIVTPVAYLHGAADGCVGAGCAAEQDRWLRGPLVVEVVPGVGHFLQVECPELVVDRVDRWIAAHADRHLR